MSEEVLSFLGMANVAVRLVRGKYPEAKLYEGNGVPSEGPTTDSKKVDRWGFVFRTIDGGTATIKSKAWGEFAPVQYTPERWLEDIVIPWPVKMELSEATTLLEVAGYTAPFSRVILRWPLGPRTKQPFYIFHVANVGYVFVGIYDRSVTPNDG